MSNTAVGALYKRIIDAVVEASRTDFEENGVENRTLVLMQETWQKKLSTTARATFPWDPQPAPQPVASTPVATKTESMQGPSSTVVNNGASAGSVLSSQTIKGNVNIKQEPSYDSSFLQLPQTGPGSYSSALNPNYAGQRAAHLIQQQFGSQANNSISAMQAAGVALPSPQQRTAGQAAQSLSSKQTVSSQNSNQKGMRPVKPEFDISQAQTDGAADASDSLDAVVVQRDERGTPGEEQLSRKIEVGPSLRRRIEHMAQRLEGGGLMLPLVERTRSSGTAPHPSKHKRGPAALDGGDDSDDLADSAGEDAINSDLDDSDDGLDNGIEANFDGDMILCVYDKVQRVKNKWKCTLKDGVVTVDGKDYVFHKAQGEFEW